jgi:hypothetical protein
VSDHTVPAMFGYFAETFLMTASELERKKKHLLAFAASQGSEMQAIFTEHLDTRPAAIESLIQRARREKVTAVAVTAAADLGTRHRRELEEAGIRILIAGPP